MSVQAVVAHNADSFAAMRGIEALSVDVMITDPPYNEHVQGNMCSGSLVGTKAVPKYALDFAPVTNHLWIGDAVRITRRWVVAFSSVEEFGEYKRGYPAEWVRGGIWYKSNAMGQLTADRPATAYEGVSLLHGTREAGHPKKRWNGRGSYGIWRCNGTRGLKDRHPNEKPMALCLKLVALFSERGETVFDPFCGSGAIGEACIRLGRHYVGFDQNPEWVSKAQARVSRAMTYVGPAMSDAEALALCTMPKASEVAEVETDAP